jgi:hypothetical protein
VRVWKRAGAISLVCGSADGIASVGIGTGFLLIKIRGVEVAQEVPRANTGEKIFNKTDCTEGVV